MPKGQLRYKAGKFTFLLVCLFFLTACGKEKAVFEAGDSVVSITVEETKVPQCTEVPSREVMEDVVLTDVAETGKININEAYEQELMTLPGIGESRAAAIIEYRSRVGGFKEIEEIMNVKGIGTGIFSKISSLICVK